MGTITIDVDIDDIISSLGRSDRRDLLICLQDDGYIPKELKINNEGEIQLNTPLSRYSSSDDFNLALQKLFNNGWKLTSEEEQYVINLSKKFL